VTSVGVRSRIVTNLFIVIHLVAIVTWEIPVSGLDDWPVTSEIRAYMRWAGLWQSWSMFAPDPLSVNVRVDALVTGNDGRTRSWNLGQFRGAGGWWWRFRRDRYRKWVIDHVRRDDHALLWSDAARFALRQAAVDAAVTNPISVTLVRRWRPITLTNTPTVGLGSAGSDFSYAFFTYQEPPP
jgi:hypothetical protein